jgi:pyrroloquinoline-quinone synthase
MFIRGSEDFSRGIPMPHAPHVTAAANAVLDRVGFSTGPYFAALADGSMTLESFRLGQEQFFYAVQFYARPIAALACRIPDPADRLDLIHNLVEEHGDLQEPRFHQNTFRAFLATIGARRPDPATVPPGPAVHAFNAALMGACTAEPLEVGICCLGIIELAFAHASAAVGRAVLARGWVSSPERLVHYGLHAELDVEHAAEFFELVEAGWDDPARRTSITAGLELGAYVFDRLYRDLAR